MFEVRGLCKGYGESGNYTVEGINLQINKGSIHGLIGHNGSGKTTIIKCLTGIYKPDQGTVTLDGKPVYEKNGGFIQKFVSGFFKR